jgi:hypothetical protein
MSGGSSRGKGKGKAAMKGNPFLWEGPLGPKDFEEAIYDRFPLESKHDFTKEAPLRAYDDRKEEWPKCMHGEDCLVQMYTEGIDGGRRFFKCPRAWVSHITNSTFNKILSCAKATYLLQSSLSKENCGFTRWVDPRPIHPHAEYIYYLQDRIFDLETEVSSGYKDDEDDDNNNATGSQNTICNDPYCTCPNHKNKGPPSPPPPPPPPTTGGYYGEGATQFAMWPHY